MNGRDVEHRDWAEEYWIETVSPALEGRLATVFSLSNGHLGLRGTHEEMPSWASPGFYIAGTYCRAPREIIPIHPPEHILVHPERVAPERHAEYRYLTTIPNLPNPVAVRLVVDGEEINLDRTHVLSCERRLHMRESRVSRRLVVRRADRRRLIIDSERLVSWADRNLIAFRYRVEWEGTAPEIKLTPILCADVTSARGHRLFRVVGEHSEDGLRRMDVVIDMPAQHIFLAQAWGTQTTERALVLDVMIGVSVSAEEPAVTTARRWLARGYDAARAAHVQSVVEAMERSHAEVDADLLTRQGFHFGRLHLEMALAPDRSDVSVPIKGLTGEGYRFMVFWDTDFHLFPYYLFTNPKQARNLILYRYGQLNAYRRYARQWGFRGAQVPWETATSGEEETAPWLNLMEREIHMSADSAMMVWLYDEISGDDALLAEAGAELVFETARFYASRVTWNAAAERYELRDIGCPDQYHTFAHNNVFISRMAKWNLEYAASLASDRHLAQVRARIGLSDEEAAEMARIGRMLYVIPPNDEGLIEEFEGYFNLSTDLRGISEQFCVHTQAVKQPDVLALYGPFGHEYSEEVLQRNWRFYAERTLHGSSLSLPGMALAAARAGLPDEAAGYFQRSTRMDLDDVNLNTNLGVHLAGYGVQWQTIVFGFSGLTARREGLTFQPRLPRLWGGVEYALHWRGCRLLVSLRRDTLCVAADDRNAREVPVTLHGMPRQLLAPGKEVRFALGQGCR